jgi:hypothetical protein
MNRPTIVLSGRSPAGIPEKTRSSRKLSVPCSRDGRPAAWLAPGRQADAICARHTERGTEGIMLGANSAPTAAGRRPARYAARCGSPARQHPGSTAAVGRPVTPQGPGQRLPVTPLSVGHMMMPIIVGARNPSAAVIWRPALLGNEAGRPKSTKRQGRGPVARGTIEHDAIGRSPITYSSRYKWGSQPTAWAR